MHEFSTMQQIVHTILQEGKKQNAQSIKTVTLEIGEMTFLGFDQLQFAFDILKEHTILEHARLILRKIPVKVSCTCGYTGKIDYDVNEAFHIALPLFKCPQCQGDITILEGKECIIKSIELEVENVTAEG
jgi:hydrogenase nickel incorporation protein HypA/HybF